jgi:hypothetical protein
MSGLLAPLASVVFAAAVAVPSTLVGTFYSIAVVPSGTVVGIAVQGGNPTFVTLAPDAAIREKATGGDFQRVGIEVLKSGEPVTVFRDVSGRATRIDAEYTLVDTRMVTAQDGRFVGTDGVVRDFVGSARSAMSIPLGAYVELRTVPGTGDAFDISVSSHPFVRAGATANDVAVTFEVRVPVNTPASSTVYMATNAQNWTPNTIRMTPEPGNRWTATVELAAGTVLQYKYTRGSWTTGERDAAGSEIQSRTLTVAAAGKTQQESDAVARWADLST